MHSFSTLLRFIWRSSRRAAVFVVGVALVGVGLVMFVTPGPGIVLVVAGLAVLATEFAWAEHLLDKAKESAAKAGRSAKRLPGVSTATAAARRVVPRRWQKAASVAPASGVPPAGSSGAGSPSSGAGSPLGTADTGPGAPAAAAAPARPGARSAEAPSLDVAQAGGGATGATGATGGMAPTAGERGA